jgi:hypothetical protein
MGSMRGVVWSVALGACGFSLNPASEPDAPVVDDAPTMLDAPLDAYQVVCPSTYVQLGATAMASSYRVVDRATAGANWVNAELDCRDDGPRTHLAIAETAAEHVLFEDAVSGASLWLGVTDRKVEGTWRPIISGTSGWFTDWFGGAQPATNTNYNCLLLSGPNFEEAMPCSDGTVMWTKGFICECDGNEVDLTAF